jgi:4-amino-4-deoxy-L-arabinose transferase-like glycosyltransferase
VKSFVAKHSWRLTLLALAISSGGIYFSFFNRFERSEYYSVIAHSMSMSFSNFIFGASDPAGTITLDKIPGAYWVPAIFVKIFGFSTASVTIPNGLATVATVLVIALAAKRIAAGLGEKLRANANLVGALAGALIAVTPIISAVARSNQPESFFLLFIALALHRAVIALQTGSRKQLIYAGLFVAGAFQMYMIEAWTIWPALIIAWFSLKNKKLVSKIVDLAIAGSISLVASLTWIFIVLLTPAGSRPYIGGTYTNSPIEMVFGYNALGRFGQNGSTTYRSFTPPFSGSAGWLRLFNEQVAGQIAWFIVPAALALILLIIRRQFDSVILFAGLTFAIFYAEFSLVAGMHQFYTAALALPIALIFAYLWSVAKPWMLVSVGAATVASQLVIGSMYSGYFSFMPYLAAIVLAAMWLILVFRNQAKVALVVCSAVALGLAPAAWSVDTVNHPNVINPVAGPDTGMGGFGVPGGMAGSASGPNINPNWGNQGGGLPGGASGQTFPNSTYLTGIIDYVKTQVAGNPKYLLAVFGTQTAAPIINDTGASVMPIGGFDGSDPAPTLKQFIAYVESGDVQFVVWGARDGGPGGFAGNQTSVFGPGANDVNGLNPNGTASLGDTSSIADWVKANCKLVTGTDYENLYRCVP